MNAKRLISATVAAMAIGTFSGIQPASANPAGAGNYAASVATTTTPTVAKSPKTYSFGAVVRSTSSSVGTLHGTLAITVERNGAVFFSNAKTISVSSGTPVNLGSVNRKRFPGSRKYNVTATFTAASGHIEKSSSSSITVKL